MDVRRRYQGFACVFFLALVFAPAIARAADPVEKVTALNKKALDQYKRRDYEAARALLKQALEICQDSGLDSHPIKARTHIHLGVVALVGFKDHDLAIKHFHKALEIQPDIKLTPSLATKDLEDAFEEAALAGGSEGGAAGGSGEEGAGSVKQMGDGQPSADGEDEEGKPKRPPPKRRPPPKKKKTDDEDSGESAGGQGDDEGESGPAPAYRLYMSVTLGSGFGLASGNGDLDPNMHKLASAGFAPAQLGQLSPEIGYFFSPQLMLSVRGRFQYVSGVNGKKSNVGCGSDNFCTPSNNAVAAFVRASYFLGEGSFRWFLAGELGGGAIKHAQVFNDNTCGTTGNVQCVDSLSGGPFLFGPAFGMLWDLGSAIGLTASLAADLGVPKFTVNFDVNLGMALHF
jgi:hypothetical protein